MSNSPNTTNKTTIDNKLILERTFCSVISISTCLVIIISYFILSLRVYKAKRDTIATLPQTYDSISSSLIRDDTNKVGLATHFMFFLVTSNFFEGLFNIISYIMYVKNNKNPIENCKAIGFFLYFFDIQSISWTSIIAWFFWVSTKAEDFTFKERKYFVNSLLYSFGLSSFSFLPIFTNSYHFVKSHCLLSPYYSTTKATGYIFSVLQMFIILGNVAGILKFLVKVNSFYIDQIKEMVFDKENINKRKSIIHFLRIIKIFPLILIISRLLFSLNRIIHYFSNGEDLENKLFFTFLEYSSSATHCLNGFVNSLFCLYFFTDVFLKCKCDCMKKNIYEEVEQLESENYFQNHSF